MTAAPDPVDYSASPGTPEISQAAQSARQRLHEEIERVRHSVEEMLDEQDNGNGSEVRRELEELRIETRDYVKRKVRKSEKKLERSIRELDARSDRLERRIDEVEAGREAAEVRIHNDTEEMLDGLLTEMRTIADRIAGRPASAPRPAAAPAPAKPAITPPQPPGGRPSPQGPVGRIGPKPFGGGAGTPGLPARKLG